MTNSISAESYHVTAVIAHSVKRNLEKEYEDWLRGIVPVAKSFDGHLGVQILRPHLEENTEYVIVLHFDHHQNLKRWLESEERHKWIELVQPLIQQPENVQVLTGLETWFELPKRPQKYPPKRYKIALITWLGVLFLSLVVGRILNPLLEPLPWLLKQIITSGLIVWLLAYFLMPQLTRLFYRWLYPK
ncbi:MULTISPECIES: antibiotic biosynthesis monooxygenase [Pseudanabaena]|uniref:Antibiotic biosynthesis monooxygenase n=2 Tax=Pseudanabaena TaxID=1152 RepID=L8N654_9CYAN|nr:MULTISPECIES: antibiotic biosynthesis monooxygenase [Pseudanabaena]ELS33703.1 Antibiotic biosynthesis monooxygenase [Pseudanabaena biceps PCC 7429]MDG3494096.1 antibiotic biosynthesis monooxygenase [Pseudanabaena catenata USMAC16]